MSTTKKTVGVIFGSRTVEHDVSIITAQQVMQALTPQKFDVVPIYITRSGQWITGDGLRDLKTFQMDNHLTDMMGIKDTIISPDTRHKGLITPPLTGRFGKNQLQKLDVVFPVMHGTHGEDGTLQGLLELADLPYVGAGVMAAAVARDKIMLKAVLAQCGIPVLKQVAFSRHDWITTPDAILAKITSTLTYPVFIKPATKHGISSTWQPTSTAGFWSKKPSKTPSRSTAPCWVTTMSKLPCWNNPLAGRNF
jgi:D-alanine-D-alanine ligase